MCPTSIMKSAQPCLLGLPAELREMIFSAYLSEPNGYVYNPTSGKLRAGDGKIIDLALMYTCRQIAWEMRDLPLRISLVTFHPVDLSDRAWNYHRIVSYIESEKSYVLKFTSQHISKDVGRQIVQEFPHANTLIGALVGRSNSQRRQISRDEGNVSKSRQWGMTHSQHSAVIESVLELACLDATFPQAVHEHVLDYPSAPTSAEYLADLSMKPTRWTIPSHGEIETMAKICEHYRNKRRPVSYHFSATAAAYAFLSNLKPQTRLNMRRIRLCETRLSVADPACHALGLVQFCTENSHLRVSREVDMFQAVFPEFDDISCAYRNEHVDYARLDKDLPRWKVVDRLTPWLEEAAILQSSGMPHGAFSIIFKAPPFECQQVLDTLIETASWQDAAAEASEKGYIAQFEPLWKATRPCCPTENFSQIIKDTLAGSTCISFENASGSMPDIEALLAANKNWSAEKWDREYVCKQALKLDIVNLPSWHTILKGYLRHEMEPSDDGLADTRQHARG